MIENISISQANKQLCDTCGNWHSSCIVYWYAANAVNKTFGRCPWHAFALTMATANTIPAPAGITLTAPPLPTKWAGRSDPVTMFTISTGSKLTTVTPTSPSFRHLPMPKFITNNFKSKFAAGANSAAGEI